MSIPSLTDAYQAAITIIIWVLAILGYTALSLPLMRAFNTKILNVKSLKKHRRVKVHG